MRICMDIVNIVHIGIYEIRNTYNGKRYIGKSENISKRLIYHNKRLLLGNHTNKHLQAAWDKYGCGFFEFRIIELCGVYELNSKEKHWIKYYKTHLKEFGYNKTLGGTGGRLNDEALQKMAKSNTGKVPTIETRNKISMILKGKNKGQTKETSVAMKTISFKMKDNHSDGKHPHCGRKHTDSAKLKISLRHKGHPKSEEHKQKLREANLGKIMTDANKQKMIDRRKGT